MELPMGGTPDGTLGAQAIADLVTRRFVALADGPPRLQRACRRGLPDVLVAGRGDVGPDAVAAVQREFSLREALGDDWAAVPVALVPYDESLWLVLRDPGGEALQPDPAAALDVPRFLRLGAALAAAVGAMHGAGVLHLSLRLDRFLVDAAGRARLTGFSYAARARANGTWEPDTTLAWDHASFACMAPELGGRMGVPVDRRADLYALGCILYRLLVGFDPFDGADTAALVHAHATREPLPPSEVSGQVPNALSRIVMKLLAKAPDGRYADAASVAADLRRCEDLLMRHGHIPDFALDRHEAIRRLQQWDVLYGRDRELAGLAQALAAVRTSGHRRAVWLSGRPGIGKSRLLGGLRDLVEEGGGALLTYSKVDESHRAKPYAALVDALDPLLQFVLGREEDEYAVWRERLRQASSGVERTLVTLLPALAAVTGHASTSLEPQDMAPTIERERVLQGMARLIAAFCTPERPLVMLLDDLHWADMATVQVLDRLLKQHPDVPLLLVGAFRPIAEQGGPWPPVRQLLDVDTSAAHIVLEPLSGPAMHQLIAGALAEDSAALTALSEVVGRMTDSNPLHVQHMLGLLAYEGLLEYDVTAAAWRWSLDRIAAHPGIGSVAALLAHKLDQMPVAATRILQVMACLGTRTPVESLALAAGLGVDEAREELLRVERVGVVSGAGDDWVFSHDRFREAAYLSIPESQRASLHLEIARRQLRFVETGLDVFSVAAQANLARALVSDEAERRRFARLNLDAGHLAKSQSAHDSALVFFRAALDFLGHDDLGDDGLRTQALCGEAEFMTGDLDAAEARLTALQAVAGEGSIGGDLARLRVALYTALGRFDRALEVGIAFAAKSGVPVSLHPTEGEVDAEYARLKAWIDRHGMAALRDLPVLESPALRAIADIFADLIPPAMYTHQALTSLLLLRLANFGIQHGLSGASADGFSCMSLIFGVRYGDFAMARAFGELAIHLVEQRGLVRHSGRVYMTVGTLVVPWTAPARSARAYVRKAYDAAVAGSDHTFAVYCGRNEATGMLFAGESLDEVQETVSRGLAISRDANFQMVTNALESQQALLSALRGEKGHVDRAPELPADTCEALTLVVAFAHWVYRLQAALLLGRLPEAVDALQRAEACAEFGCAFAESGDLPFYGALALVSLPERSAAQDTSLDRYAAVLRDWAATCPENFLCRSELVTAEVARVRDRPHDAADAFVRALAAARGQGFVQVEAMVAERAARFHAGRGDEISARAHLRHARSAWQRWGAGHLVRRLEAAHPEIDESETRTTAVNRLQSLDVLAVLRLSNALASDIVPERLVDTLMRVALESVGATHGILVLRRDGECRVAAKASVNDGTIVIDPTVSAFSPEFVPTTLVQAVLRSQDSIVVHDVRESPSWGRDAYVRERAPRSVLCVPLMRYATVVGALYLENNLAAKMFTPAKAALLEVIGSQAGFALENARLYEDLVEQNRQRAEAEEQLRNALADVATASRLTAMGELVASIVHEVGQPIAAVDTSARAGLRWLDRPTPEIGEARDMLSHICACATRAKAIIEALRAKARQEEARFERVDLAGALREAAVLVSGSLDAMRVTLDVHGPDGVVHVQGDRIQLQQVAINLLVNGAEAMSELPAVERRLSLGWVVERSGAVSVSIEDLGSGISPEVETRLFQPLFTTKAKGMGMGLAICKSILDAHGGTLEIRGRGDRGTRVRFTLPAV